MPSWPKLTWFKKLLADDASNPSSMRILLAIPFLIVCVWAYCVIRKGEWIAFDVWTASIISGIIGSKVAQKIFGEPSTNSVEEEKK